MNKKSFLITGGAGFIGGHLAERLIKDSQQVTVIDDLSTGNLHNLENVADSPNFTFIRSKVSECKQLEEIVEHSDVIFHLAAAVGVKLIIEKPLYSIHNNLHETEAVLNLATKYKKVFLLASTSEVYGKSTKESFVETDDLHLGSSQISRWNYACSKLMDEFMALASWKELGTPVVITRLFNIVGPRQTGRYGMVLPNFVKSALENRPLTVYGDGSQTRCFCHVHDAVEALTRLVSGISPLGLGEIFNIGTDQEISIANLAKKVIEITQSQSVIEYIPYEKAYSKGFQDMMRRKPSVQKLASVTGFAPSQNLESIIRDISLYYRH